MNFRRAKSFLMGAAAAVFTAAGICAASFPAFAAEEMGAQYAVHLSGKGWTELSGDNTYCQAGPDSFVTAVRATLINQPEGMTGTISYQVNLSGSGWLPWQENYGETGTTETGKPLEAVKFSLTGELAENYDIYYSVLQDGMWTELAVNGQTAGVEAQGKRVDGIRVAVTKKDAGAPQAPQLTGRNIDPSKPMVALTFDDGPSNATGRILDSLEANGGAATFYMVGNRINGQKETVKRMADIGCEIGSHTWSHTYLTGMSEGEILGSLGQVDAAVMDAAGVTPKTVRPPGGYIGAASKAALAKKGVPAVMWSIDTLDWKTRNPQKTIDSVLTNVKDGDIVLMHDLYGTTADAAEVLIPELTKRGYQLVTVSELAAYRGGMVPGEAYSRFRP